PSCRCRARRAATTSPAWGCARAAPATGTASTGPSASATAAPPARPPAAPAPPGAGRPAWRPGRRRSCLVQGGDLVGELLDAGGHLVGDGRVDLDGGEQAEQLRLVVEQLHESFDGADVALDDLRHQGGDRDVQVGQLLAEVLPVGFGGLRCEGGHAALPRLVDVLDVAVELVGDLPEGHAFLGAQADDLVLSHEAEVVVRGPPGHVTSLVGRYGFSAGWDLGGCNSRVRRRPVDAGRRGDRKST